MDREADDVARRRFACGSAGGIVVSAAAFAWMVTGGTFQFFQSTAFSSFYDVQARSLLHGTFNMPANVLNIEGIRTAGHTDMYYGPFPALLRMPVLVFTHRFDGRLTAPSLLLAFVAALVFTSLLSWRIRGMVRGAAAVSLLEAVLSGALVVLVGLGSVFLFLGANAIVYEEAEMWGAALTLGAFFALIGLLHRPSPGGVVATGVLTTLAMLTRGSVGAGPVVAVALALGVYCCRAAGGPCTPVAAARAAAGPGVRRHGGGRIRALLRRDGGGSRRPGRPLRGHQRDQVRHAVLRAREPPGHHL